MITITTSNLLASTQWRSEPSSRSWKKKFARFGIPNALKTDNGPQFALTEVSVFAKTWMSEHKTSSSTHAQSNGKAENAVQTVKRLFKKCKTSGDQNSKHFLISADYLLQPSYPTDEDTRKLIGNKQLQKFYYNKHRKLLQPIVAGDTVQMKLPGQDTWTPGTCLGQMPCHPTDETADSLSAQNNHKVKCLIVTGCLTAKTHNSNLGSLSSQRSLQSQQDLCVR